MTAQSQNSTTKLVVWRVFSQSTVPPLQPSLLCGTQTEKQIFKCLFGSFLSNCYCRMISSKEVIQLVKKKNDAFSKSNKVLIEIASKTKSIHHLLPLLIDVATVYTQQCSIKSKISYIHFKSKTKI